MAIDRSSRALASTAAKIRTRHPTLALTTVHTDFSRFKASLHLRSNDRASGRALLFLPNGRIARFTQEIGARFLRRIAAETNLDAMLIIGVDGASPAPLSDLGSFALDEPRWTHITAGPAYSLPRFEALIRDTGWQHAQFWTDAQARFGIHVLRRV